MEGRDPHAAYAWLISPFASVPEASPTEEQIECACAFLTECWQQIPSALPRFLAWIGQGEEDRPSVRRLRGRGAAIRASAELQRRMMERIVGAFDARAIRYTLLKSSAVRWYLYDSPLDRSGMDIDMGVQRDRLDDAVTVLKELGFVEAQWNQGKLRFEQADPILRAVVEAAHYELGFLVRRQVVDGLSAGMEEMIRGQIDLRPNPWHITADGGLACYVVVDMHHGISPEITVDPLIASRVAIPAGQGIVHVPRDSWTMLHMIYKIYWEGVHTYREGFYQYGDLCRLAMRIAPDEVEHLRTLLAEYRLKAAAYYVLRRLGPELRTPLPPALIQVMEDGAIPPEDVRARDENDLGDMWPKLWGRR